MLTFLLTEQLLLAYVLLPELRNRFWTLVVYLLIIATTCLATSTIGLMCSALARRTSTAMVLTYLTLLVLFVLPMGLQGYLQMFASVTEEQLAALTVTSPFSAALSVPMHTTRSEAWMNQPLAVADQTLVPIAGNLRMPVYAVFLCHLPGAGAGLFLRGLPGVSLAMVASRRARLGERALHFPAQGTVLEIPHPVRPAHQGD